MHRIEWGNFQEFCLILVRHPHIRLCHEATNRSPHESTSTHRSQVGTENQIDLGMYMIRLEQNFPLEPTCRLFTLETDIENISSFARYLVFVYSSVLCVICPNNLFGRRIEGFNRFDFSASFVRYHNHGWIGTRRIEDVL
jgi:hypothetical protein